MFKKINIRRYEVGLKSRDGEFVGLLDAGKHIVFTRFGKTQVNVVKDARRAISSTDEVRATTRMICSKNSSRTSGRVPACSVWRAFRWAFAT